MNAQYYFPGSIVSFNVIDASGHYVPFSDVGRQALQSAGIVLRTGCFCNVGACQTHLLIPAADVEANFATGRRCGGADGVGDVINGRPTGNIIMLLRMLDIHIVALLD